MGTRKKPLISYSKESIKQRFISPPYNLIAIYFKGKRMTKLNMAIVTAVTLALIGCGGGGSSAPASGSTTTGGGTTTTVNTIDSIHDLKPYLGLANKLVTGTQKTSCLPTEDGKGRVIKQFIAGSSVNFYYDEYSNTQCTGDYLTERASYSLTLGNEINEGKALEVNLKFDSGDDIVDKVPNHMLGYDIANTFYTTIVASGNEAKKEIKLGLAKPTDANDGSSPEKRANDVSDYTSGKYYFSY
jgi:hypothetical protein